MIHRTLAVTFSDPWRWLQLLKTRRSAHTYVKCF